MDSDGSIKAQTEETLSYSIISKGMLAKVRVNYTPCHQDPVRDSMNTVHSPVGKVELRWYKKGKGKSHAEPFYVVDRPQPLVILGATAFVDKNIPAGKEIHPIGLKEQTAGNVFGIERVVGCS